jgi:hypothetical protein
LAYSIQYSQGESLKPAIGDEESKPSFISKFTFGTRGRSATTSDGLNNSSISHAQSLPIRSNIKPADILERAYEIPKPLNESDIFVTQIQSLKEQLKISEEIRLSLETDLKIVEEAYKHHFQLCQETLRHHGITIELPGLDQIDNDIVKQRLSSVDHHYNEKPQKHFESEEID